ncbi:MAG: type II toxin-antitoxin system RelE/ParE family toxin [Xanthobacteraceae bacterium]
MEFVYLKAAPAPSFCRLVRTVALFPWADTPSFRSRRRAPNPLGWRERTELLPGIHSFPVHPYTVFYRIADNVPEIVRVLHERRDAINILSSQQH